MAICDWSSFFLCAPCRVGRNTARPLTGSISAVQERIRVVELLARPAETQPIRHCETGSKGASRVWREYSEALRLKTFWSQHENKRHSRTTEGRSGIG